MGIFAVTYQYEAPADQLAEIRPIHRQWLTEQLAAGSLLASGPMVNTPGALLIWRSESLEDLAKLLDNDPFDISGCIGERAITEWNPIFGPWS